MIVMIIIMIIIVVLIIAIVIVIVIIINIIHTLILGLKRRVCACTEEPRGFQIIGFLPIL